MNADPKSAKAIFLEAVERHAPDQWPAFLDRACAGQPDLRGRVEALLEAHREVGTVEHREPAEGTDPGPVVTVDEPPLRERPGDVIGPYKLLEQIGEGGFGVVYLAEQTEPVRRKVALKVIKPGMDTRQVVARFEAERQALAMMDHPNIAKVFDGGATRLRPAVLRDGAGQGRADHRVLRPEPPDPAAAAGAVHPGLPGGAARAPEGDHPPRPQALQRPGRRCTTTTPVVKVIDFGVAKALGPGADRQDAVHRRSRRWSARRST